MVASKFRTGQGNQTFGREPHPGLVSPGEWRRVMRLVSSSDSWRSRKAYPARIARSLSKLLGSIGGRSTQDPRCGNRAGPGLTTLVLLVAMSIVSRPCPRLHTRSFEKRLAVSCLSMTTFPRAFFLQGLKRHASHATATSAGPYLPAPRRLLMPTNSERTCLPTRDENVPRCTCARQQDPTGLHQRKQRPALVLALLCPCPLEFENLVVRHDHGFGDQLQNLCT